MTAAEPARQRIVLVTGLSGAGKSSILRVLEDLGYGTVDNPPLALLEETVLRSDGRLAIGVDARTSGFDADRLLDVLARLRAYPQLRAELVYALADDAMLLRRYTETRRRHPLAPQGRVVDGIALERAATLALRQAADRLIDTSDLQPAALRQMLAQEFAEDGEAGGRGRLGVSLVSFAYPAGLPRDADLVLDARFLRNPHYDPVLRPQTGRDAPVAAYIAADADFAPFLAAIIALLDLVLPRFLQEGKTYATIAIGCTGGRHRSVLVVERLLVYLTAAGWRVSATHRELTSEIGPTEAGPNDIGQQAGDAPEPEARAALGSVDAGALETSPHEPHFSAGTRMTGSFTP